MGFLRVTFALAVLLTHAGGIFGYVAVGGEIAVQCFYVISGFYIGLILNEKYNTPALNGVFYLNRALRIYVLYFAFLLVAGAGALVTWLVFHKSSVAVYGDPALGPIDKIVLGLLNFTVIGQDSTLFLRANDGHLAWTADFATSDPQVQKFLLIPQAWSLSLELMFYALAPFIARRSARVIGGLALLCLGLRVIGYAMGFRLDPFSYRFFPFELSMFLLGTLAYKLYASRQAWWGKTGWRIVAAMVPIAVLLFPLYGEPSRPTDFFEPARIGLLALLVIGLPAIHAASSNWRADRLIGELSFPIYLGHLIVVGTVNRIGALHSHPNLMVAVVVLLTLALAAVMTRVIDLPLNVIRQRIVARAKRRLPTATT